jgi:hypothetical protein
MDSERKFLTEMLKFGSSAVGVSYHTTATLHVYMFVVRGMDEDNLETRQTTLHFNF